jgi:hypothetical protein
MIEPLSDPPSFLNASVSSIEYLPHLLEKCTIQNLFLNFNPKLPKKSDQFIYV